MNNPRITILLSAHNRESLIREALDSVIMQTYTNWECLVTDDSSTDDTPNVIKEYSNIDKRIKYFLKPDEYGTGLAGTRNYGLDLAKEFGAEYIQFFDDDDIMYPTKLEKQIKPLIEKPTLFFSVCNYDKILQDESGKKQIQKLPIDTSFNHLGDAILTGDFRMNSLGPLWKAEFLYKYRFDERLQYAEEWELYVRMGYEFPSKDNFIVLEEALFGYRKHAKTLTLGNDENFEKRKASAICNYLICDFLNDKKLHTKRSLQYFAKRFSALGYQRDYLKKLEEYARKENYTIWSIISLMIIRKSSAVFYRILGKMSTWI